ncbi:MAG: hypothetical protein OEU36_09315 [Gammaproteobacteria bacterium]|nr:hypothetical protein [Gammaproteobacteria bacterium]
MSRLLMGLLIGMLTTAADAQDDDHHDFPPSVMHFHEIMAPLVHAPPSPERAKTVCQNTERLNEYAARLTRAPVPDGVSGVNWSLAAERLSESTTMLRDACADNNFKDSWLADVNSRFHQLVRLVGHDH